MMLIAPEILILVAEAPKKAEGMTIERWIAIGGFALSVVLGLVTFMKFLKERKDSKALKDVAVLKAPAEKDSIMVTGAQSAVLMMQQVAEAARAEADRKQTELEKAHIKIAELEERIKSKDEKIDELEEQLRKVQEQLNSITLQLQHLREDRPS